MQYSFSGPKSLQKEIRALKRHDCSQSRYILWLVEQALDNIKEERKYANLPKPSNYGKGPTIY